ncbi:MAG: hypothetical protein ABJD07_10900 [Gemmatimonadaceae bacterium]
MTSPQVIQLCVKLSRDSDAGVREISRRCLSSYSEFTGMKYARLTSQDVERMTVAAQVAKGGADRGRARLLGDGVLMIQQLLTS